MVILIMWEWSVLVVTITHALTAANAASVADPQLTDLTWKIIGGKPASITGVPFVGNHGPTGFGGLGA